MCLAHSVEMRQAPHLEFSLVLFISHKMAPLSSRFLTKYGLTIPLVQAPMANVSTPKLALEVHKYGGLGSLPLSPIDITEDTAPVFELIREYRKGYDASAIVNCNFFCFDPSEQHEPTPAEVTNLHRLYSSTTGEPVAKVATKVGSFGRAVVSFKELEERDVTKMNRFIDQLIEAKVGVVSFHFGVPSSQSVLRFQAGGISVWGCVTSTKEAKLALDLGLDALVCQGYEAGGHRGNFLCTEVQDENLSTSALFEQVKKLIGDSSSRPLLIPAGGIDSPTAMKDYLLKGADAVQAGTIFITAEESAAPSFIKDVIQSEERIPTIMTRLVSGRAARTIATPFILRLIANNAQNNYALPTFGYSTAAFRKFSAGDTEKGFYLAGQNYFASRPTKTTQQIMLEFSRGNT